MASTRSAGPPATERELQRAREIVARYGPSGLLPGRNRIRVLYGEGEKAARRIASEVQRLYAEEYGTPEPEEALVTDYPDIQGVTAEYESTTFEDVYERATADFENRHRKEETKAAQSIRFRGGPVCVVFSGDEHFGDTGTDVRRAFEEARLVSHTPGCFHFKMGDVTNQFILGRMRAIRDGARMSIPDEWRLAEKLVELTADRLIAWVSGNHTMWHQIAAGFDYMPRLLPARALYDPDEINVTLYVGQSSFRVRARHKWQGTSIYSPTHGIERAAKFDGPTFDIGVGAHTHIAGLSREFIASGARRLAVLTGTYKRHDTYQIQEGFTHGDGSTAVAVILHADGSWFTTSNLDTACRYMTQVYSRIAA